MIKLNLSPYFKVAFSEKKEGNIDTKFARKGEVVNNLSLIADKLNISAQEIIQAEQVHQCHVASVTKKDSGRKIKNADALISDNPDITLMMRVADCIPIILLDPKKKAIGLAHSGWRGTVGKIVLATIQKMMQEFNCRTEDIKLYIGPCIQKCCNSINKEPMQSQLPEWNIYIKKKDSLWFIDLPGFIKKNALEVGINKSNISSSQICTMTANNLFSHRRSKSRNSSEGRFAAIIKIRR